MDLNGGAVVRVRDVDSWAKQDNCTEVPARPHRVHSSHSPVKAGSLPLYNDNDSDEAPLRKPTPNLSALLRRIPPPPPPHRSDPIPLQRPAQSRDVANSRVGAEAGPSRPRPRPKPIASQSLKRGRGEADDDETDEPVGPTLKKGKCRAA